MLVFAPEIRSRCLPSGGPSRAGTLHNPNSPSLKRITLRCKDTNKIKSKQQWRKKLIKQGVFYLFDNRQRKGKRCILVRYRIGGQFKYVKTGIYIRPNCWDAKRHRAFSGDDYKEVNRHLKAFRRNIESQFELVEGVLTADIVDQIVSGTYIPEAQRNRSTQFVLYARMVNRILYENGRFGLTTMRNKESGINCFDHYEKELLWFSYWNGLVSKTNCCQLMHLSLP